MSHIHIIHVIIVLERCGLKENMCDRLSTGAPLTICR